MTPLPFDPIARAAELWDDRVGPSTSMAAVTSVMRVQQIIQSAVDAALKPHGLTFARYEALVLLYFSRPYVGRNREYTARHSAPSAVENARPP